MVPLRYLVSFNPRPTSDSDSDAVYLPMEAISEFGQPDTSRRRLFGDLRQGYSYVANGDVAFAKVTPCFENGKGLVARNLPDGQAFATTEITVMRPSTEVDADYLGWILQSSPFLGQGESHMTGSGGLRRVPDSFVGSYSIPLPDRQSQRDVADYLDRETARIDTLIEEQQRLIEMLRERRGGVVTNTFLNSANEEHALKFAVDDVTVGIVVQPSRWYVDTGVPALRGVNVKRGSISRADLVNISEEGHAAHSKSQLFSGDVVVVRTGNAGAAAKIPDELDGANAIDILIIRPGQSTNPDFLVWYLNSPLAAARIEHGSVGALQGHFNVGALRELPLPVTSLAEQQRIVAYLDEQIAKIDTTIAETERFIELVRERRAALITAAVTGQIDVREMA